MNDRSLLPQLYIWPLSLIAFGILKICGSMAISCARDELAALLADPTPTPVALVLAIENEADEVALHDAYHSWLTEERGVAAEIHHDLEDKAYYLAGEAPRLHATRDWPQWYGLRYAVGPASGRWGVYWPGCDPCPPPAVCYPLPSAPRKSMATASYPGLDKASEMGAAVVMRGGVQYLAVTWPGTCPTPQPLPTPDSVGPYGPGW